MPAPQQPEQGTPPLRPSRRSLRGLDWFIFFVADVQTGFGPFVSVYLTTQHWTQIDIGLVLSAGGFVALIGQMPGGALVDDEGHLIGINTAILAGNSGGNQGIGFAVPGSALGLYCAVCWQ